MHPHWHTGLNRTLQAATGDELEHFQARLIDMFDGHAAFSQGSTQGDLHGCDPGSEHRSRTRLRLERTLREVSTLLNIGGRSAFILMNFTATFTATFTAIGFIIALIIIAVRQRRRHEAWVTLVKSGTQASAWASSETSAH